MTRAEFDRTFRALCQAIRFPGKYESLQKAAESWQTPPRTTEQIERLQSMTLVELWEFSQQLKEKELGE